MPTLSDLDSGYLSITGGTLSVPAGRAPASTAWVVVNQPDGTSTIVWPVTLGGQKLFAFQLRTGPNRLRWTDHDTSGAVVGSMSG
jgi:hypothetical protein